MCPMDNQTHQVSSDDAMEAEGVHVEGLLQMTLDLPSARDQQVMVGPSDIADPCDICVARAIARSLGIHVPQMKQPRFSLAAWWGTAGHMKIEKDLPKIEKDLSKIHSDLPKIHSDLRQEVEVEVENIPGLGLIKGHVDLQIGHSVVDWKGCWRRNLSTYKKSGPPERHVAQVNLYIYGERKKGRDVRFGHLVYIPRDSNNRNDVWRYSMRYDEKLARDVLVRTQHLVDVVRSGKLNQLDSYSSCFMCNPWT